MALIKCPECRKEISSKAPTCPNCGCPISSSSNTIPTEIHLKTEKTTKECPTCDGIGRMPCPSCKDSGGWSKFFAALFGIICPLCKGDGEVVCSMCGGAGKIIA